jgi:hypothetical protein
MIARNSVQASPSKFREVVDLALRSGRIPVNTANEMKLHVQLAHPKEADAYMADIIVRLG